MNNRSHSANEWPEVELDNYFLQPPSIKSPHFKCVSGNKMNDMLTNSGSKASELSCSSSCEKCELRYKKNQKKLFKRFCLSTSAHGFHNLVDELNDDENDKFQKNQYCMKSRNSNVCEADVQKNNQRQLYGSRGSVASILQQNIIKKIHEPRPKIITGRRLLWLLIITSATIGFTIHLTFLIMRYLELRVNTQTEVMASKFVFPDVTLCSTDTFSKLRLKRDPLIPHLNLKFSKMLNQTRIFWQKLLKVPEHSGEVNSDIVNSLKGYLHKVNVTSQAQDMIVHCHYKGDECSFTNFTFYADPVYMGCFTFSPHDRYLIKGGEKEGGLKVIIYAGDGESYISDEEALSYFKGMRVVVHPKGTRPNLKAEGFYAETSHNTIVQLGYTEIHVLDKPTRRCFNNIKPVTFVTGYSDHDEDDILINTTVVKENAHRAKNVRSFTYTLDDCHIDEYQQYLLKTCDCVSESLPVPIDLVNQTKNFCHRIADDILLSHEQTTPIPIHNNVSYIGSKKTANKRECHDNSIDIIHTRTANIIECPFPCFSEQYNMRITRANWPNESEVVSTALKHAVQKTLQRATKLNYDTIVLENLLKNFKSINVSRNFLKLDVYAQSKMGDKVEETWVYPARNLFSDLGGILGLWLGVSTITIFEFFELAFNLFKDLFNKKRLKNKKKRHKHKFSPIKVDFELVSSNGENGQSDDSHKNINEQIYAYQDSTRQNSAQITLKIQNYDSAPTNFNDNNKPCTDNLIDDQLLKKDQTRIKKKNKSSNSSKNVKNKN